MANRLYAIVATICLLSTSVAAETQWRFGANLASFHIASTEEFNEFNPGAFVSVSFRSERSFQYGLQFGGYVNSYSERTLYGLAFANWHLLDMNRVELRVGVFAGLFEYPNLVERARVAGWPTVGNMVLALGPSLTLRIDDKTDITIGYLPVQGKETSGVITLQTSFTF